MSYHRKKGGTVLMALILAALAGCGDESKSSQTGVEGAAQTQVSQGASHTAVQGSPAEKETSPAAQQASSSADQTAPAATSTTQAEETDGKPRSLVEQGGEVYAQCAICHGPYGKSGIGKPLAGQSKEELIEKMKLYRAGKKIGVDSSIMTLKARMLTDRDIEAVATYIAERLKER